MIHVRWKKINFTTKYETWFICTKSSLDHASSFPFKILLEYFLNKLKITGFGVLKPDYMSISVQIKMDEQSEQGKTSKPLQTNLNMSSRQDRSHN